MADRTYEAWEALRESQTPSESEDEGHIAYVSRMYVREDLEIFRKPRAHKN